MRKLFSILNLILCFELIVSPLAPSLSIISVAKAEGCPAGLQMDPTLNRCLTTAQTANVLNATASCAQGDVACYRENAQKAFQDKVNAGEAPERKGGGGFVSSVTGILSVAGPVTIAVAGMSTLKTNCGSYSFYAMIAGAAAVFIGDTMANLGHKKRLKKIKEDWGKIVNPEEANGDKDKEREASIEAQSESFEMLARAEDSLAKAAKLKKTFFTVATLAYGVSTALALTEMLTQKAKDVAAAAADPATKPGLISVAMANRLKDTCTPNAASIYQKKESLYSYYTEGRQFNLGQEIQFQYNLTNSKDLVSFIMNKKEMEGSLTSPEAEFLVMKTELKDMEPKDPAVLELFKATSMAFLNNLNPFPSAIADEPIQQADAVAEQAEPSVTSSSSAGVQTNAAKAYKEDKAKGINWMGLGIGVAAGVAAGKMVSAKMITPAARAVFSGVMAGMTLMMANHAGSQAEASTKRAELLRKMKEEFKSAAGAVNACGSEDRSDPGKPNCYCYTPENQRNSNRGNSAVCQKLWAGVNLKPTTYASASDSTKVCITNTNQADPACKCKQTKTCMKVGMNGIQGLNAGTMSMMGQSLAPLNGIANGSVDAANLNSGALGNQASKMSALVKELEKNKNLGDYNKKKNKAALQLTNDLNKAAAGLGSNSMLGSSGGSGMPSSPKEAALMLEKEVENSAPTTFGGADSIAAPTNSPADESLEFGLTADQLNDQEGQIAEVMAQDLDYGGNDINQGSKTNIFDVLSNRYQRSGMRRLFDEKGTTEAEKPATTEINQ